MAVKTLAIKYRPACWEDVVEQTSTVTILQQQLASHEVKNAYLFTGPAGCGKTTCARIFANNINHGQGNPIELDAASQNGVDDVRGIIQQAKTKSLDSEYKVFILDEVHAFSNSAWQAMLKLIEEPPAKSIFIFCTTDPQKIPKTILSRVQRYDFQRISQKSIVNRLCLILAAENQTKEPSDRARIDESAVEYLAKMADGGMRDAITLLDKCLAFSQDLTVENVVIALGTIDYNTMFKLSNKFLDKDAKAVLEIVEDMYSAGKDIKQFVRQYLQFLLDVQKYGLNCDWKYLQIPKLKEYAEWLDSLGESEYKVLMDLLDAIIKLNADIKWSTTAKYDLEVTLFRSCIWEEKQ